MDTVQSLGPYMAFTCIALIVIAILSFVQTIVLIVVVGKMLTKDAMRDIISEVADCIEAADRLDTMSEIEPEKPTVVSEAKPVIDKPKEEPKNPFIVTDIVVVPLKSKDGADSKLEMEVTELVGIDKVSLKPVDDDTADVLRGFGYDIPVHDVSVKNLVKK